MGVVVIWSVAVRWCGVAGTLGAMRLALAPINPTVGDLAGNARLIAAAADQARAARADVLVCPELALTGYPPKDLLLQQGFLEAAVATATEVAKSASHNLTLIFGTPWPSNPHQPSAMVQHNTLIAARDGAIVAHYHKRLLPTYDVFDEDRYFTPGVHAVLIDVPVRPSGGTPRAVRVGLSVCEDLWYGRDAGFSQRYAGAEDPVDALCTPRHGEPRCMLIVNPSASPFVLGKAKLQEEILRHHAARHGVFVAAVNQLGANDELIFDGAATVVAPGGRVLATNERFAGGMLVTDLPDEQVAAEPGMRQVASKPASALPSPETAAELFSALVTGIRDYAGKTGFKTAVLGLSGGIDSAVCAVLAAAALGPGNVHGISMPSRYSSEGSKTDASELAANLGMPYETIAIEESFGALLAALGPLLAGTKPDVTEENLQSRIRGTLLMGLSNKFNHLLLTTGNKSELAVGYCTLYGDMNGGLAVLSDVTKQHVYSLARWMNANRGKLGIASVAAGPIPEASITKPPSAELRPDQKDQDSLPPYEVLDEIISRYVEQRQAASTIVAETGFDAAVVAKMVRLIDLAEYKRKQAPIGLKVTTVAFGSGRRMPIAQRWRSR